MGKIWWGNTGGSIQRKDRTERKEIEESIAKKEKMVLHTYSKHYKYNNRTEVGGRRRRIGDEGER